MDTHSGAGVYDLESDWALKNGEFADGVGRLSGSGAPPMVARYLEQVRLANPDGGSRFYPGSPWLALQILREHDRLRLFELHPTEAGILAQNLAQLSRTARRQSAICGGDGFQGLKGMLPPPTRRGLVIIDPSYEDKLDYRKTLHTLEEGLKRFATGCFLIWYPLVQRREARELARAFERIETRQWVHATLTVRRPFEDGLGLHGSGVFVVNPPWTLYRGLRETLPWLARKLAQDDRSGFTLTQGEPRPGALPIHANRSLSPR
jgi:23S rRNA (adenine2030-N6)-methyltransferase